MKKEMTKKQVENYKLYTNTAYRVRGIIINEIILLERMIDGYLANYFCTTSKSKKSLKELILCTDRITFGNKREVFQFILETENPAFLKKHPNFLKNITEIIKERNIVAHYWLNTSDEAISKIETEPTIELIKFKNVISGIVYNDAKIKKILLMIKECIETCFELDIE